MKTRCLSLTIQCVISSFLAWNACGVVASCSSCLVPSTSFLAQHRLARPSKASSVCTPDGGVSPPPSPPTAISPSPTMAPGHGASSPGSGLASLHHAIHGLHNLHNLHNLQNFHNLQQNLQTQMAALAGLQGGLGVPSVGSLLHPHLAQQHPGEPPRPGYQTKNPVHNELRDRIPSPLIVLHPTTHHTIGHPSPTSLNPLPPRPGIAVQPILTIPLGQAGGVGAVGAVGGVGASSLVNPLVPLHHLQQPGPHPQQPVRGINFPSYSPSPFPSQVAKVPPHAPFSSTSSSFSFSFYLSSSCGAFLDAPCCSALPGVFSFPVTRAAKEGARGSQAGRWRCPRRWKADAVTRNARGLIRSRHLLQFISNARKLTEHKGRYNKLAGLYVKSPIEKKIADPVGGLGGRLGGHYPAPPPPPSARYSPDFLDNHISLPLLRLPPGSSRAGGSSLSLNETSSSFVSHTE
ncbi:hypothetical protein E2C01_000826 [Portunus trituberculatus]|uniref:Uncharacterized protein n=1 Tax=Portunus trituberculatus TaxID=210409 RepID=A0A5B7CG64_PORTR|nr:hypothetical protein [Portunus trituberculatus]